METSHTSSDSAESRLVHLRGRGLFPNLGRHRRVERTSARAPETIEHEGKRMTQREVMAEKQKKMDELREKAKKAKEAKDALRKKIEQQDHDSPFPTLYNYAHDADAVKTLEREITNLEQKMQKLESTSWRTAMDAVKDAEQTHDEIVENIQNTAHHLEESADKDQERQERRKEYMAQADEQFGWVRDNLEGKSIDVQYINVSGDARIGAGAKQLIERAKEMEDIANRYDALDGKISQDENYISRLRAAAKQCRDLYPAMQEHEQGILKMQRESMEKQKEMAPRVQAWKNKAETFKGWSKLEAGAIAADRKGVSIVDNWIRAGKELQAEYTELASFLEGTDAALNDDIERALPQLENLKTQVKQLERAEKVRTVLEPVASLQGMSGTDAINVLGGDSRSALEKVKGMIKDLEGVAQEMLDDGVQVASPEAQALVAPMNELKRIQAQMEQVTGIEHQEREENDKKLIQEAEALMSVPLDTLVTADLRAHVRKVTALLEKVNARLSVDALFTDSYTELQRMSLELGGRLDVAKAKRNAERVDTKWEDIRDKRRERLIAKAKEQETFATQITDAALKAKVLADAEYFRQEANKVHQISMEEFQRNVQVEKNEMPRIRQQLEDTIAQLEQPTPPFQLSGGMASTWSLGVAAFNALMELRKPEQIAQLKRQLAALPDDLDSVPDMA